MNEWDMETIRHCDMQPMHGWWNFCKNPLLWVSELAPKTLKPSGADAHPDYEYIVERPHDADVTILKWRKLTPNPTNEGDE